MLSQQIIDESNRAAEALKKSFPLVAMLDKLKNSSPEEKKNCAEISKKIGEYSRKKDLEGLLKYLAHVKTKL